MEDTLPPVGPMTTAWVDFFIMLGAFTLVAIASLIWVFYFRKTRRRHRRKRRHPHDRRPVNPTLAEVRGLPPPRPPEPPSTTPSPTP